MRVRAQAQHCCDNGHMSIVGTPDPQDPDDSVVQPGAGDAGWLTEKQLDEARRHLPMVYVEALPVRIDDAGRVVQVGLLLRVSDTDSMTRTIVSGRVRFGESVRDALARHLENDIGPIAFPQLPLSIVPQAVGEYFPVPTNASDLFDGRQHAVSLAFVVPVTGTCQPRTDALELTWLSPAELRSPRVQADLEGNRGVLIERLLAAVGA